MVQSYGWGGGSEVACIFFQSTYADGTLETLGESVPPGDPVTPGLISHKRQDKSCSIQDSFLTLSQCVGFVAIARQCPEPKVHRETD